MRQVFHDCNDRISRKLSRIPNLHETSLDHSFIEHFTHYCRPVKMESEWTVRFDCHFIGGGRHYMRWEVADVGILVVFRQKGRVLRSKVTLLQSKRLYPNESPTVQTNPLDRDLGFNYLFMNDERWAELNAPRTFTFSAESKYRALKVGDGQYKAIEKYEQKYRIPVHYLLYNPLTIPWSVSFPITLDGDQVAECDVGCRIVPSKQVRKAIALLSIDRPPSYGELSRMLGQPFTSAECKGGWRMESYVVDELLSCKDGLIDETPQYAELTRIFSQKTQPIHSAMTITFDMP